MECLDVSNSGNCLFSVTEVLLPNEPGRSSESKRPATTQYAKTGNDCPKNKSTRPQTAPSTAGLCERLSAKTGINPQDEIDEMLNQYLTTAQGDHFSDSESSDVSDSEEPPEVIEECPPYKLGWSGESKRPATAPPAKTQSCPKIGSTRPATAPSAFFSRQSPQEFPCNGLEGIHTSIKTTVEGNVMNLEDLTTLEDPTTLEELTPSLQKTIPHKPHVVQGRETPKTCPNTESVPCREQKNETPVHLFYAPSVYPQNRNNFSFLDKGDRKSQTKSDSSSGKSSVKNFFKGIWRKVSPKKCKVEPKTEEATLPTENTQHRPETEDRFFRTVAHIQEEMNEEARTMEQKRAFMEELMKDDDIRAIPAKPMSHFPKPTPSSAQPANTQDLTQNKHHRPKADPAHFQESIAPPQTPRPPPFSWRSPWSWIRHNIAEKARWLWRKAKPFREWFFQRIIYFSIIFLLFILFMVILCIFIL